MSQKIIFPNKALDIAPPRQNSASQSIVFQKSQQPVLLLLENIDASAIAYLKEASCLVHQPPHRPEDLEKLLPQAHLLGIRSKSKIQSNLLAKAHNLLAIGCFCIGTDQVDLLSAQIHGITVFNSPFGNTRSVAEMVLANIIILSRKLTDRCAALHQGHWQKDAKNCFEVRGKTLGIIGYGNIGSQIGIMAENFGMKVLFYDVLNKLPLGNNQPTAGLKDLLQQADFITLHVPELPSTHHLIAEEELKTMKKNAYLINLSRGHVVDVQALSHFLKNDHLRGAAIDVFPEEPDSANTKNFTSPLQNLANVVLTPHIGGSTEEAQAAIGKEVSHTLMRFIRKGSTHGSVNFPAIDLERKPKTSRILNVHHNVPGVLSNVNSIAHDLHINIESQILATHHNIGYLLIDIEPTLAHDMMQQIYQLPTSIRSCLLPPLS